MPGIHAQVSTMGRKRSNTPAEVTAEPSATPDLNGAMPAATAASEATVPATKKEAVRLALQAKVRSPTEIADYVRRIFGMEMTPAHVSTIKGQLKREKKGKKPSGNGRRKKQAKAAAAQPAPPPSKVKPATQVKVGGLLPEDLTALLAMAQRAGGIARLVEYLEVLKRVR
jgi:hypothetical protein